MDISQGAKYQIKSLYELPGAQTRATINGTTTQLTSPWKTTTGDLAQNLPLIIEGLSLTDAPYIDGRININLAPREILAGLPPFATNPSNAALVDQIVGAQVKNTGQSTVSTLAERQNAGWLVIDGITTINILETLDPYITARGDVFHLQSIGFFEGGGPMARVEAVIDATQDPPQVIFMRDLSDLGRGFTPQLLMSGAGATK